jgi:apolipoprotein N-acyltransferase
MTTSHESIPRAQQKIASKLSASAQFQHVLTKLADRRLTWVWLGLGILLLPFTFFQTVVPLAGWLAPVFLLRFMRSVEKKGLGLFLVFLAFGAATFIAGRGMPFSLLGFIGTNLFKPLLWTLPFAADLFLTRRLQGWARTLVFPCAFVSIDWLVSVLRISSAGSIAYSQAGVLPLLQILSITGMWGITFFLMWCAAILSEWWEHFFQWHSLRGVMLTFAGLLAATFLFGSVRLILPLQASQTIKVAMITIDDQTSQDATRSIDWANFNRSTDTQRASLRPKLAATVAQMMERSETALKSGAKIVAWQESSGWVLEEDRAGLLNRGAKLAKQYAAYLQISLEVLTRTQKLPYILNQSVLIDPAGDIEWVYDKSYPVIYDEAFNTIAGPGKLPIIDTPYGLWSAAICYDTYFPTLLRQAGRNNATLLFAPTNDPHPWEESTIAMAYYQNIENGFSMIRPTGNGISALIDPLGRVLASQEYSSNPSGIVLAILPISRVTTIYSRIGNLFAYLSAVGCILLSLWAFLSKERSLHSL